MKTQGFTLIELLIVVTIFGLLSIGAVASFNQMNDRSQVEETTRNILEELISEQKDANAGNSGCQGAGNQLNDIVISYVAGANQPLLAQDECSNSPSVRENRSIPTKKINSAIVINAFSQFAFLPLNQGISSPTSIVIQNKINTVQYTITLTAAGGLSVSQTK